MHVLVGGPKFGQFIKMREVTPRYPRVQFFFPAVISVANMMQKAAKYMGSSSKDP